MVSLVLLLGLEPVGNDSGTSGGSDGVLTLDLDGHALVLLQAAGEVSLLGGGGGAGEAEGLDLALSIGGLDGRGLVGLELLEVQLLDEVGCEWQMLAFACLSLTGNCDCEGIGWRGMCICRVWCGLICVVKSLATSELGWR